MDGSHPGPGRLPTEIPVFPLAGALLLPHGKLPLHIFEPRYKAMVEDALAENRVFGMIQPDTLGDEAVPSLYRIGCVGRLSSFSETEDGRYLIALTGLIRFEVRAELAERRGYRRVSVDFSRFIQDLDPPETELPQRAAMLAALRSYFSANQFEANWDAIDGMDNDALVVTLCMVCPFDPPEKQALLEAPTPADRADTLVTLLRMGAHTRGDGPLS